MKNILAILGMQFGVITLVGVIVSIIIAIFSDNVRDPENFIVIIIFLGVIGCAGSLISLLFSKTFIKKGYELKTIDGENPADGTEAFVFDAVAELSKKAGLNTPEVCIWRSDEINAFATGPAKDNALVAVSEGLLASMEPNEVRAVLAHEVTHISNGDMVKSCILDGTLNTIVLFCSLLISLPISFIKASLENFKGRGALETVSFGMLSTKGFQVSHRICRSFFGFFARLISLWFSRTREFRADAGSANLVSREDMVSALEALKRLQEDHPISPKDSTTFCINGASAVSKLYELFMTHPLLDNRIQYLNDNYDAQSGKVVVKGYLNADAVKDLSSKVKSKTQELAARAAEEAKAKKELKKIKNADGQTSADDKDAMLEDKSSLQSVSIENKSSAADAASEIHAEKVQEDAASQVMAAENIAAADLKEGLADSTDEETEEGTKAEALKAENSDQDNKAETKQADSEEHKAEAAQNAETEEPEAKTAEAPKRRQRNKKA